MHTAKINFFRQSPFSVHPYIALENTNTQSKSFDNYPIMLELGENTPQNIKSLIDYKFGYCFIIDNGGHTKYTIPCLHVKFLEENNNVFTAVFVASQLLPNRMTRAQEVLLDSFPEYFDTLIPKILQKYDVVFSFVGNGDVLPDDFILENNGELLSESDLEFL